MRRDLYLVLFWAVVLVAAALLIGRAMDHTIATYYLGR
jgi:hypothetical protein